MRHWIKIKIIIQLVVVIPTSAQYFKGYEDFFYFIKLYKEEKYGVIEAKLKNDGYEIDTYTPEYTLEGITHKGDFSFKKTKEYYYKNTYDRWAIPYKLISSWTFKTEETPSQIVHEIKFRFEDKYRDLFKYLKQKWEREIGPADTLLFKFKIRENDRCAFFRDETEVWGKNVEKEGATISLTPIKLYNIISENFVDATCVLEGEMKYRTVKYPINQDIESYYDNLDSGLNTQTISLKKRGSLYTINIIIGGKEFEYIIDSGASDINISNVTESYLKDLGVIRANDYLKTQLYTLADGSQKEYRRVMISKILIGGIVIENISASINDEGNPLLLGKSFLDKFSYWKIDNEKSVVEFRLK